MIPTHELVHISRVFWLVDWIQEEIGEVIGLAQPTINERLSDLPNLVKLTKSLLGRGDSVSDVAD
jgi:hypothetical protein